ncbi:hypothetical protein ASPVEDRAFT_45318 [Aspergillus versicolor CBS 583.65]|uniref:Uncharacterized protein n=1 Tax=Aspergillus versicolor CBS 583.65 TaxID=1036611 RepID=A0A1L9PWD6_ASPVE|nr:uncharacterized protein ASPVEDRAFT_45318 [Aspergillus versicolor CBS 583.65]OJJ05854.1 hypothetical protein ASPVEDRAFT_45318 [Aspergillus versicolor CBS 583.65]
MPTDDAYFAWRCDDDCKGPVTIRIRGDDFDGTAFADWSDSSTTLAPSFLPAMRPEETSVFTFSLYSSTRIDGDDFGIGVFDSKFSLFAPTPTTKTVTQTQTVTTTSEHTMTQAAETSEIPTQALDEGEDEGTDDSERGTGGLSTGGKAGIGVGVAVGAILLAAGAFLVVRRRKRVETATIREIPATSAVNLPGPGPGLASNQANTAASGPTYEMRG